jgi:hypothetical protein
MIFCDWPASERPKRPKIARKFDWSAPGYETLITQVFVKGDPQIEEDVVFTGSDNMVGDFKKVATTWSAISRRTETSSGLSMTSPSGAVSQQCLKLLFQLR